jgi:hypothetical protein
MRTTILLASASLVCLAADSGRLKTEIDPGRAGVFIDGKYVGPAENFKISRSLPLAKPPFGQLRTENPDHFAAVYVNGHYMGHVDEFSNFAQGLLITPGHIRGEDRSRQLTEFGHQNRYGRGEQNSFGQIKPREVIPMERN